METKNAVPASSVTGPGANRADRRAQPASGVLAGQLEPGQVQERLKAERVQERLKALPGWRLAPGGRAIDRVRQFPAPGVATAYAAFASALAGSHQQPIAITLAAGQVVLTLSGQVRKSASSGLTEAVLDLAAGLG